MVSNERHYESNQLQWYVPSSKENCYFHPFNFGTCIPSTFQLVIKHFLIIKPSLVNSYFRADERKN